MESGCSRCSVLPGYFLDQLSCAAILHCTLLGVIEKRVISLRLRGKKGKKGGGSSSSSGVGFDGVIS